MHGRQTNVNQVLDVNTVTERGFRRTRHRLPTTGHPSTMVDYFHQVADVLGMPRLPEVSMNEAQQKMSPAMRSYLSESRRLMNDKLLGQLGITLKYPNLKTGLAACVKGSYRAV